MRRESFAGAGPEAAAAAFNRVFTGYLLPMQFTPDQLELHIELHDVDRSRSPLWYDDAGNVIAAALVGVRGARTWIGGFGVAPEYRGAGHAKRLLAHMVDDARARGAAEMWLEVLAENAPAIALYKSAGFEITRTLRSFLRSSPEGAMPRGYRYEDPDCFVDLPEDSRPCWQREPLTLRHGAVTTAIAGRDGEFVVYRYYAQRAQLYKLRAQSGEQLDALVHAVAADRSISGMLLVNEPAESPIAGYAASGGWSEPFSQYEMRLALKR